MAQTYKTGLIITGDASGGIRAIKATEGELGKLNQRFERSGRQSKQFGADATRAGQQLRNIDAGANEASRGLEVLRTSVAGVAAGLAAAFGAGSIVNQARMIADTDSLAKSIGMATGNLQAWDYAAQQAGLAGGQMGDILKDITERIGEFTAEGTGEAAALFKNLNLNINEMKRLAPDQQLLRIADAISALETRGEKISYLERLGSDATRLLPLLDNNAALLREYTNEAQALGVAMSQMDIDNAIEANRAMSQLTGTMTGFTNQVVADLGPGLATAVGGLTDFIQEAGGAASILEDVKDVATLTAAIIAGRYAGAFAIAAGEIAGNIAATIAKTKADVAATNAARAKAAEVLRVAASEKAAAARAYENSRAIAAATGNTALRTKAITQMAAANQRAIAAEAAHTAAIGANTAAMQRHTVAAYAMAAATRAGSAALALVGGPAGAAMIAGAAAYYFRDSLGFASAAARETREEVDQLVESMDNYTEAQYRNNRVSIVQDLAEARIEAAKLQDQIEALQEQSQQESIMYQGRPGAMSGQLPELMAELQEQNRVIAANEEGLREYDQAWQDVLQSQISGVSIFRTLDQWLDEIGRSADSAGDSVNSGAPTNETLEAWGKYNDRLRESIAASRDGGSALGATTRAMDSMGEGVNSVMRGYTAFLSVQDEALKDQKQAQEQSAAAAKQAASESARAYEQAARAAEQSAKQQADALRGIQHEMDPLLAEHATYIERIGVLDQALSDSTITQEQYGETVRWAAEQYTHAATGAEDYEKQTESLISTYDRHNQRAQQLRDALEQINQRYRDGEINGDQYARMVGGIRDEMQQLAIEAAPIAKELARSWEEAADRINETFGNAFTGAYDSFEDFGDSLMSGVKRLIGEITYQATLEPIVIGVTTQARGALGIPGAGGQQAGGGLDLSSMGSFGKTVSGWFGGGAGTTSLATQGGISSAGIASASQVASGATYGGWAGSAASGAAMGTGAASGGMMAGMQSAMAAAGPAIALYAAAKLGDSLLKDVGAYDAIGIRTDGRSSQFLSQFMPVGGTVIGSALDAIGLGGYQTEFSGRFGTTGSLDRSEGAGKDGVFEHQDGGRFYGESALGYVGFRDQGTERLQRAGTGDKAWAEELANATVEIDNLTASLAPTAAELAGMRDIVQGLETSSQSAADIVEFALEERPRAALEALEGHFGDFVRSLEGGIEIVVQQAQVAQQAHSVLASGMERLNLQFDASSAGAYDAASNIAALVGGPDSLSNLFSGFYDSFYTEEEKFQNLADDLSSTFSEMGQEQLATVLQLNQPLSQYIAGMEEQRRAAVEAGEAVDDSAESMRAMADIARERSGLERELLQLQGNTEELRRRELAGIDESNRALQERIWAINDERAAAQEATAAYQQAISGVESAYQAVEQAVNAERQILENAYSATTDSINANIATVQDAMQESSAVAGTLSNSLDGLLSARRRESMASRREAQGYLQSTLASGGLGDADQLERALGAVSEPSEGLFSSFTDYQRDFYQTANVIAALEGRAEEQVSTEEQSLRALENQLQSAARQHEREMESLDSMLLQQQLQIENELGQMAWLESINGGVMGVTEAIGSLGGAISAATAAQQASAPARSTTPDYLSAKAEQLNTIGYEGRTNWTDAQVADAFKEAGLTQQEHYERYGKDENIRGFDGSHADGLWSVPFDGYRAELHNGEAVLPAPAAAAFRDFATSPNDNEMLGAFNRLIRHVESLEKEVKELKSINKGTASHTSKLAGAMDRMRREQEATT